jgi:hypothetical protein
MCIRLCANNMTAARNERFCEQTNDTSLECLSSNDKLTEFYELCAQDCFLECEYSVFDTTASYSEFPSRNYADYFRKDMKFLEKFAYQPVQQLSFDRIQENILKLNIYFGWVDVFSYEEAHEIDFNEFLANIGGQLGKNQLFFCWIMNIFIEFLLI